MSTRNLTTAVGDGAFLVGLATLPWVGLGLVAASTGRDLGAGFQPAYIAFAVSAAALLCEEGGVANLLRPWKGIWGYALLALLISAAGIRISDSGADASLAWGRFARQIVQWLVMVVITLVSAARLRRRSLWRSALFALALGVGFQLVYGLVQVVDFQHRIAWFRALDAVFTSNPSILSGSEELYLGHGFTGIPRVRGTACEPLYLGNYLLAVVPFLLLAGRRRRFWLLPAAAGLGLLAATWSRGAWLAGGGALVAACVFAWRLGERPSRRGWLIGAGLSAGAAMVLAVAAGPEALGMLWDRLGQSLVREDWSNLTRLYSMQAAWRAFLTSPVVGVGWGQFGYHFHALVDLEGLQAQFDWPVVNNFPLEILCETGLVGFGIFIFGAWNLGRRTWAVVSHGAAVGMSEDRRWMTAAAAVAVVGTWGQMLTFSQYNLPHIWVVIGALLAVLPPSGARGGGS